MLDNSDNRVPKRNTKILICASSKNEVKDPKTSVKLPVEILSYICQFLQWEKGVVIAQILKCEGPPKTIITAKDYEEYELGHITMRELMKSPNEETIFIPHIKNYMCFKTTIAALYNRSRVSNIIWQCSICWGWNRLDIIREFLDGQFHYAIATHWLEDDK